MTILFSKTYPHNIVLGSTSPFRISQLKTLGYDFKKASPNIDESALKNNSLIPEELSLVLAVAKAESLSKSHPQHLIIGADQVCHLNGKIFSKPGNSAIALGQLLELQGQTHCLSTSFCVNFCGKNFTYTDNTFLTMRPLTKDDIQMYLNLDAPFQSCGSYMYEINGHKLFCEVKTSDPSSIVGLPLLSLQTILLQLANEHV